MDDSMIVDKYLSRDESAIKDTSDKYGMRIKALAKSITDDILSAEECENDTYMQAWNSIPPHEPRDYLYAFLIRITRHLALNCCRNRSALKRSAHISELSDEMQECIPDPNNSLDEIDRNELIKAINEFLGTIKENKRNIFMRRYWYMDSVEAIAARYKISESKVKTTLFRVRNDLKVYLWERGYET